ncbi:MAG: hypothetical protein IKR48_06165 [Kiritimatiellae bacterium]|nr:hypothetical protein [Kiritimatiellia bacterium]
MKSNQANFNEFLQSVTSDLPPMRPLPEIRELYRSQIATACNRYLTGYETHPAVVSETSPDLVVSLKQFLQDGIDLIRTFAKAVVQPPQPALCGGMMTRGFGGTSDKTRSVQKQPFSIRVKLSKGKNGIDVSISPIVAQSELELFPFLLTVIDLDNGKTLLDKKEFSRGAAILRGVEMGNYRILVSHDEKTESLDLKVEE